MSNHTKQTIAQKALIEMDAITAALKEESKKSLNTLLIEAVKNALREECEDDDDCDYDVLDGDEESPKDTKKKTSKEENESGDVDEDEDDNQVPQEDGAMQAQQSPEASEVPVDNGEEPVDDVPAEDPMNGGDAEQNGPQDGEEDVFSKYQVGDNTYDLTGEKDQDAVVKVYKLLTNDDNIVVKQDGNTVQLVDNNADTEYVIDFGGEDQEQYGEEPMQDDTQLNEDEDFSGIAGFPDDDETDDSYDDDTYEFEKDFDWYNDENFDDEDFNDNEDFDLDFGADENEFDDFDNNLNENKKSRKPMKKNKKNEVLFEIDLGYTDNYQDKDPISGLSNNEPAKGKKDWDAGIPKGTKKPFAGDTKSKGTPFEDTVNEEDEMMDNDATSGEVEEAGVNVGGAVQQRTTPKSKIPNNRKEHGPYNKRHVSTADSGYEELVSEAKKIKAENKQLKESVKALLKNLNEAYVTNYNLGKITKLFVENVTTQEEKVDIVNRFANDAKTTKQSDSLFESIQKELQKSHSNSGLNLTESKTANGTKQLNEVQTYASKDLLRTKDLMNRILEW